jgi:stress response protein SCP2
MADLRRLMINTTPLTHLRVGIKWDPLERDALGEDHAWKSAEEARGELGVVLQEIKSQRFMMKLLGLSFFFRSKIGTYARRCDQNLRKQKIIEKYLAQEDLLSHDLDLYCFCYDKDGKFVQFVSPHSTSTHEGDVVQTAFVHSGDDSSGTGDSFDEEMLVKLSAIDAAIDQVFFLIVAVNQGFDEIKGGFWSIVNTIGEVELLFSKIAGQTQDRVYVIAKLSRAESGWVLEELRDFCSPPEIEEMPTPIQVDQVIIDRYLVKG